MHIVENELCLSISGFQLLLKALILICSHPKHCFAAKYKLNISSFLYSEILQCYKIYVPCSVRNLSTAYHKSEKLFVLTPQKKTNNIHE